jgi:hypothetical protein
MERKWLVVACVVAVGMGFITTASADQLDSLDRGDIVVGRAPSSTPVITATRAPMAGGEDCTSATVIQPP